MSTTPVHHYVPVGLSIALVSSIMKDADDENWIPSWKLEVTTSCSECCSHGEECTGAPVIYWREYQNSSAAVDAMLAMTQFFRNLRIGHSPDMVVPAVEM